MHKAFAARNKVESVRKRSRSGGAFAAFSEYFIDKLEGAVYGAVLDDEYKVVHMRAADHQTKEKMCGAKYVQSEITGVLAEIVDDLREGKKVLFAGTPCQVAAVKPLPKPQNREAFWNDFEVMNIKDFVKKYGKMNLKKKLRIIASRAKMLIARNGR